METARHRDLLLTAIPGGTLVTACDSCGAVGEKERDRLKAPPYVAGRFTARVVLMEVLAAGADIVAVTDALACELEPTGREVIRGILEELAAAGVGGAALNGSTEENFPTEMTAVGVTAVGYVPGTFRWNRSRPGDRVYCVGTPLVGAAVLEAGDRLAGYGDIRALRTAPGFREVVPAGSRGVGWEARNLAEYNGLTFLPDPAGEVDLERSAGPAACLLAVLDGSAPLPGMPCRCVRRIGELR